MGTATQGAFQPQAPLSPAAGLRLMLRNAPWWWSDLTTRWPRVPPWVFSAGVGAAVYLMMLPFAALAGDLRHGLTDLSLHTGTVYAVIGSLGMSYLPRSAAKVAPSVTPWLDDPSDQGGIGSLSRLHLARYFWIGVVLVLVLVGLQTFVDPSQSVYFREYPNPYPLRWWMPPIAIIGGYFVGGAISISVFGLLRYTRGLDRNLRLKHFTLLHSGKAAFRPLSNLIMTAWGLVTFPIIAASSFSFVISASRPDVTDSLSALSLLALLIPIALVLPTIVIPQLHINRLLARQKSHELAELRASLRETGAPPNGAEPAETLHRILRHLDLNAEIQQLQAVTRL